MLDLHKATRVTRKWTRIQRRVAKDMENGQVLGGPIALSKAMVQDVP